MVDEKKVLSTPSPAWASDLNSDRRQLPYHLSHTNYTGYNIFKIGITRSLGQPLLLLIKQRHPHHIVSKQAKVF